MRKYSNKNSNNEKNEQISYSANDMTAVRPSHVYNGISDVGKMTTSTLLIEKSSKNIYEQWSFIVIDNDFTWKNTDINMW